MNINFYFMDGDEEVYFHSIRGLYSNPFKVGETLSLIDGPNDFQSQIDDFSVLKRGEIKYKKILLTSERKFLDINENSLYIEYEFKFLK